MINKFNIGLFVHNFQIYKNYSIVVEAMESYFKNSNIYVIMPNLEGFEGGITHMLEMKNIESIKFDMILFTEPYIDEYKMEFLLDKPNLKKVFINYAPIWSYDKRLHFQLEFYTKMDLILCYSQYEFINFSLNGIPNDKLKLVPDLIKSHIIKSASTVMKPKKYFLLWTPHWTDYWYGYPFGYGGWYMYINILYKFSRKNRKLLLLVRPHPYFTVKLDEYRQRGIIDESPIGRGLKLWEDLIGLPNVFFSDSSLEADLLSAKYLLTDPSTPMVYAEAANLEAAVFRFKGSPPLAEVGDQYLAKHFKVNKLNLYFWLIYAKLKLNFNLGIFNKSRVSNSRSGEDYENAIISFLMPLDGILKK
jgi:hypothetical protein